MSSFDENNINYKISTISSNSKDGPCHNSKNKINTLSSISSSSASTETTSVITTAIITSSISTALTATNANSTTPLLSAPSSNIKDYLSNSSTQTAAQQQQCSQLSSSLPTGDSYNSKLMQYATLSASSNNNNKSDTNSQDTKAEKSKLENLDDNNLKLLLEEAYSYKNPADRENKSAMFLQLLQKAEKEEDNFDRRIRNDRTSSSSLQDLLEASLMDYDMSCHTKKGRHHSSRHKKNSSVSARQREGGSLPCNVNANYNWSIYDRQPFLNEVERGCVVTGKNERTISGTSGSSMSTFGYESINSNNSICSNNCTNNSGDAIIDIGENTTEDNIALLLGKESTTQSGYSEPMDIDDFDEINNKRIPRNNNNNQIINNRIDFSLTEPKSYVDETIRFPSLEQGNINNKISVDATSCVSLDEKYTSCKSILGEKTEIAKTQPLFTTVKNIPKQFDENGNTLGTTFISTIQGPTTISQSQAKTKKKKPPSERNTTEINVKNLEGFRGNDPINDLVKYIENDGDNTISNNKKFEKSTKINESSNNRNKKERNKKDKDHKENVQKLKKSNSLEELRSCSKLDAEEENNKIETNTAVQLRNKNKSLKNINSSNNNTNTTTSFTQSNTNTSNTLLNNNENNSNNNKDNKHKRGERRSWGTEELTYLGENNAIEEVREKIKEKEKKKKQDTPPSTAPVSNISSSVSLSNNINNDNIKNENKLNKKVIKDNPETLIDSNELNYINSSTTYSNNNYLDSLNNETGGFHVVTKKKKSKKRQMNDEINQNDRGGGGNRNNNFYSGSNSSNYNNNKLSSNHRDNNNQQMNKKYNNNNNNNNSNPSSNFHNDRDVYLRHKNKDKSRRKSTSSMPPSDNSESSDCESVHSLPIESTSTRINFNNQNQSSNSANNSNNNNKNTSNNNNNNNNNKNSSTKSYADMARFSTNTTIILNSNNTEKWPSASEFNSKSNKKQQNKLDFPDLQQPIHSSSNISEIKTQTNPNNTQPPVQQAADESNSIKKQQLVSNNTAAVSSNSNSNSSNKNKVSDKSAVKSDKEVITTTTNVTKQTLQKSKSVDSETYYNSVEYPALGKTMKKQNTIVSNTCPNQVTQQQLLQNATNEKSLSSSNLNITTTAASNQISSQHSQIIPKQQQQQQLQQQSNQIAIQTPTVVLNNAGVTNIAFALPPPQKPQQSHVIFMHPASQLPLSSLASNPILTTSDNTEVLVVVNNNANNLIYSTDSVSHNINLVNATSLSTSNVNFNDIITNNSDNFNSNNSKTIKVSTNSINNNNKKSNAKVSNANTNDIGDEIINATGIANSTNVNTANNSKRKRDKNSSKQEQNLDFNDDHHDDSSNQQQHKPQTYISHTIVSHITNTTPNQDNSLANLHTKLTSLSFSSTRPAVIILNDDNIQQNLTNEFTFGDFNEEELRFYNSTEPTTSSSTTLDDNNTIMMQNGEISPNNSTQNNNDSINNITNLDESSGHYSFISIESDVCNNNEQIINKISQSNINQLQQNQPSDGIEISNISANSDLGYRSQIVDDHSGTSSSDTSSINLSSTLKNEDSNFSTDDGVNETEINFIPNIVQKQSVSTSTSMSPPPQQSSSNVEQTTSSNNFSNTSKNSNNNSKKHKKNTTSKDATTSAANNVTIGTTTVDQLNESTVRNDEYMESNTSSNINLVECSNSSNIVTTIDNNQKKQMKFIEPNIDFELDSINYEKIINFVGKAWEEICESCEGTEFYDGQ